MSSATEPRVLLPGIRAYLHHDTYIIEGDHPLHTLSSAIVGGGLAHVRYIINRHVPKNYTHPNPAADLVASVRRLGIREPFVGMMTAAYVDRARVVTYRSEEVVLAAVATVGLGNLTAAGYSPPYTHIPPPSTINLCLLIEGTLPPPALVNALITATEAKVATLHARGLTSPEGHPATGTSTDAAVVACTGGAPVHPYAGPVTPIGWAIARAVRHLLEVEHA